MTSNTASRGGTYEIRVSGTLPANYSARLGSLELDRKASQAGVLTLRGAVQDQSELAGILNTLYELGTSLVSVRQLDEEAR